jgi:hypothetical protein
MEETTQNDLNQLADYCILQAQNLLKVQAAKFYPFAAYMTYTGDVLAANIHDGGEFPLSNSSIEGMKNVLGDRLIRREIKAFAIAYNCKITNNQFPNSIDAFVTRLRHEQNADDLICYFPYRIAGNAIQYYESFCESAPF